MMTYLFIGFAVGNAIMLVATGIPWFALGALGFVVAAAANIFLERIQARVVRELSKTCTCPLCKANRGE